MISKERLIMLKDFILSKDREVEKLYDLAIKYYDDEDEFGDLTELDLKDFIDELIGGVEIIILKSTKLDMNDKVKRMGEDIRTTISEIFNSEDYLKDDFFVENNNKLELDQFYADEYLADFVSDETGWLVDSLDYKIGKTTAVF